MKRFSKLLIPFMLLTGLAMFVSACNRSTCPTYNTNVEESIDGKKGQKGGSSSLFPKNMKKKK